MIKTASQDEYHAITIDSIDNDCLMREKQAMKCGTQNKETQVVSHTEVDINWAAIANKITAPNGIKCLFIGMGARTGSLIGSGIGTGIGLAILGSSGAAVGYRLGSMLGLGGGALVGNQFGEIIINNIFSKSNEVENIIQKGRTEAEIIKKL